MTFGVTAAGFVRPSVQDLLALIEADQLSLIDPSLDVSTESVLGQNNGIVARQLGVGWETLETCYHGFDPDAAEDMLLIMLSKLTGTEARAASKSTTPCTIVTDGPVTIEAGTHFAHLNLRPDIRFTPKENFEASGAGTFLDVLFECEQTGPVAAPSSELEVIATPIVGWVSITNTLDATLGRVADDTPTLRQRREDELSRGGSATVQAIRAELLGQLGPAGLESVIMFENDGDEVDNDGLPPHSFEAVIFDDGLVDDDEIAQVIFDEKAGGIKPHGNDSGTATDVNGDNHTVRFTRAEEVEIWLEFDITLRDDYVGEATFKQTVAERCDAVFGSGDDVTFFDVMVAAAGLGVHVIGLRLGLAASPTLSADLPINIRQIARFDTARIAIMFP